MGKEAEAEIAALKKLLKAPFKKRRITVEISIDIDEPATDCTELLREAYAVTRAAFDQIYQTLQTCRKQYLTCTQGELIDCILAAQSISKFMDDLRKEYDRFIDEIEKVVCERWAVDPTGGASVHGKFARGEPKYKTRHAEPNFNTDPDQYHAIMDWLGIPKDLQNRGPELFQEGEFTTKVVDIHWRGWQDLLEKMKIAGHTLPPEVARLNTWEEATVRVVKTEDLL